METTFTSEGLTTKNMNSKTSIKLLRHATLVIEIHNKKLLVDPMLSPKGTLSPVQNCGNENRFPMVEMPIDAFEICQLLKEVNGIIVTHLHRDHWDTAAQNLIDRNKLIFCQPIDEDKFLAAGFKNVRPINDNIDWEGIKIYRTKGQHGTGDIRQKMGEVSGFVFQYSDQCIYLAGDTIWCSDVETALLQFRPTVTILNAGGAKFLTGDPITMTPNDVIRVQTTFPESKIIAVHMDTVNHCFSTRDHLFKSLLEKNLASEILILKDGETVNL